MWFVVIAIILIVLKFVINPNKEVAEWQDFFDNPVFWIIILIIVSAIIAVVSNS
jgi:succinate dehydrogenase hydrophobic anchor subunit